MKNFLTVLFSVMIILWIILVYLGITFGVIEGLWWVLTGDFFHFVSDGGAF